MASSSSKLVAVMVLLLLALPLALPAADAAQYAQPQDISVSPSISQVTIKAGESVPIWLDVHNKLVSDDNDPRTLMVYFNVKNLDGFTVRFPDDINYVKVDGGSIDRCKVIVTADDFARSRQTTLSFDVVINDPDRGSPIHSTADDIVRISIESVYDSERFYGKFFGLIDNNLPSILGSSYFSAVVTAMMVYVLAYVISQHGVMYIGSRLRRIDSFNRLIPPKDVSFEANKIAMALMLLAGTTLCLLIAGVEDRWIWLMDMIMLEAGILIIGYTFWQIYAPLLGRILGWFDDDIEDGRDSALYPLLLVLGKIVVVSLTLLLALIAVGVDATLASLVSTAAGLALSFGAQSTLSQFFGGLNILVNRPFAPGDVVRLSDGGPDLKVIKIGIMDSTFREWNSDDIYRIPNNTVATATIINRTHDRKTYIMQLFLEMPYVSDFETVKKCVDRGLARTEHVIMGDENLKPMIIVDGFSEDGIILKVTMHLDTFDGFDNIMAASRLAMVEELQAEGIEIVRFHRIDIVEKDSPKKE